MKIGLLTFHIAKNIGAQLQALALFCKVESLGHDVRFIRYEPDYLSDSYCFFRNVKLNNGFLSVIKQIVLHIMFDTFTWFRTIVHYVTFQKKYFKISKTKYNGTDKLVASDYDAFIVGSDQIWNPEITENKIDDIYSLNFKVCNKLKIAYAASFSDKHISDTNALTLTSRLQSFNSISVREKQLKSFLNSICQLPIHVTIDPTLLLTKEEWLLNIAKEKLVKEKYVLLYQARGAKKPILAQTKILAQKLSAKVIDASGMNYRIKHNGMQYVNPVEFLNLVYYAEAIVTVSFHGTALSIVLEKPFYSIILNDDRDGRVTDLLKSVGLSCQLKNIGEELDIPSINYKSVETTLSTLRYDSIEYLRNALRK